MLVGGGGELGVAVVLAEEDHRQLPDRGQVDRLVERALRDRAVAEERHRDACRRRAAARRPPRRPRSAGPAATMPFAPKIPSFGSAMCIEPPRPRFVPSLLAHQLGEHPERVEPLGQAVAVAPVGRGDDVGRAAAASTRRPRPPPGRSTGARSQAPRRRGRGRRPAARSRGSPASAGASRGGRRRPARTRYCTDRYKVREGRRTGATGHDRADRDPRRPCRPVATCAGKRRGAHRRRPRPRSPARARVLPGRRAGRARRPHRGRPEGGRRRASRPVARAAAAT